MAETTPQKRVLPARERRESAAKRQASSPNVQPTPITKPVTPQPEAPRQKRKYTKRASLIKAIERTPDSSTPGVADESLPTRVLSSRPLPVLHEPQAEKLSVSEYQSYADSAILAASLYRSRLQWLCEGIFEKYWVKPTKRKGVIEQPQGNPDVKTMHKLGNATITIEPHTFDATFYTVRDTSNIPVSYPRHPNQHTTKSPHPAPGIGPPPPHHLSHPPPPYPNPNGPPPSSQPLPATNPAKPGTNPPVGPAPPSAVPPKPTATSAGPAKPTDDPVIQMLAARAATDRGLKDLMKVVAMSQATPEQLREFQGHIDEFNAIVKKREANKEVEQRARPSPAGATPLPAKAPSTPIGRSASGPGGPMHMQPPYPIYQPPYRAEPIIKHVVVEFHSPVSNSQGPATTRWLFPKYAVLEMEPGGMEMVASYFAERKGSDILKSEEADNHLRSQYQADVDYYEPITMKIRATQHRTIETIARAATTLPDVIKHMKEVMEKKTRAPREYLVHRLPRARPVADVVATEFIDSGVEVSEAEDDELKEYYGI